MTKLEPIGRDLEFEPSRGEFARRYAAGAAQVVWTRLIADLETPVSAMLEAERRAAAELPAGIRARAAPSRGRYSIIGLAPDVVWRAFGDRAEINRQPASGTPTPSRSTRRRRSPRCARCSPLAHRAAGRAAADRCRRHRLHGL